MNAVQLRELLDDLLSPDECHLDHHGYCQSHNWFGDGECRQARLRRFLRVDWRQPDPRRPEVMNKELDYNHCSDSPDGKHGKLRGGYDHEMPEGYAVVECGYCGQTTGLAIPDASELNW